MSMQKFTRDNSWCHDAQLFYRTRRMNGESRAEVIDHFRDEFADEFSDADTRSSVLLGLCLALCKKHELTAAIRDETISALTILRDQMSACFNASPADYEALFAYLNDPAMLGEEAKYRKSRIYVPDWQIGNVFAHRLHSPAAEKAGISGWYALLCKVGEYIDSGNHPVQLVRAAICPPDKLPTNSEELKAIGFLCVQLGSTNFTSCLDTRSNLLRSGKDYRLYNLQVVFSSARDEASYELERIGNFPNIPLPDADHPDQTYGAKGLWGKRQKADAFLDYEEVLCDAYCFWRDLPEQEIASEPPQPPRKEELLKWLSQMIEEHRPK